MMQDNFSFERMLAWHKARYLVKEVYTIISGFPSSERYGLSSQLGRAIISVASNLAEGSGRPSPKERSHFYEIAFGSLMEAYNQLVLASDLMILEHQKVIDLKPYFVELSKMISGLRRDALLSAR